MARAKPQIKLEEHTISDPVTGYSRLVRLVRGPVDQPQRLCLFLDGELYLQKMKIAPVLDDLFKRNALPPVTFAFIDHLNMKARERDYTCNDQFGSFIGEQIIPWLQRQVSGLRPGHHLIGGLSLSGLAAAWVALQYPGHFRYCLSQSGSFWWNDQFFAKTVAKRAPISSRFWLSVGDQVTEVDEPSEVSQIEGVKNAHQVLNSLGATVLYNEYDGGHDLKYWRAELEQSLNWLLTGDKTKIGPGRMGLS
jgi:enterochelin esterase-like enzyme